MCARRHMHLHVCAPHGNRRKKKNIERKPNTTECNEMKKIRSICTMKKKTKQNNEVMKHANAIRKSVSKRTAPIGNGIQFKKKSLYITTFCCRFNFHCLIECNFELLKWFVPSKDKEMRQPFEFRSILITLRELKAFQFLKIS